MYYVCVAASPLVMYKDAITNVLQSAIGLTPLVCKEMVFTIFSDLLLARNLLDISVVSAILVKKLFFNYKFSGDGYLSAFNNDGSFRLY